MCLVMIISFKLNSFESDIGTWCPAYLRIGKTLPWADKSDKMMKTTTMKKTTMMKTTTRKTDVDDIIEYDGDRYDGDKYDGDEDSDDRQQPDGNQTAEPGKISIPKSQVGMSDFLV